METEGLRNQLEFKSNSPFKDQIDRSSSSSIFEQLIEIRRISLPILETEGLQKSSWLDHQAHEAEGFIFLSLSRDPVSSCSLRQKASWILNSCELIIMLYEAEGLMHSQLNANQCLCCINTFFSRHGDPTRPEAEGLIAILNLLISLPFTESIDDQTDHQWQLLQVALKAHQKKSLQRCCMDPLQIHIVFYRSPIAIRKRGAPQSIHLIYGIASNSMSISWDLCIWSQLEVIKFLRLYR